MLLDSELELRQPKRGQRKPHYEPIRWEQGFESPTGYLNLKFARRAVPSFSFTTSCRHVSTQFLLVFQTYVY